MSIEDEPVNENVLELAAEYDLPYKLVETLYHSEMKMKLVYQWVKTDHVDFRTFSKLVRLLRVI